MDKRVNMIRVPFNHIWPNRSISVVRELGPCILDGDLADAAIAAGAAEPFDPAPKKKRRSRSRKADAE